MKCSGGRGDILSFYDKGEKSFQQLQLKEGRFNNFDIAWPFTR